MIRIGLPTIATVAFVLTVAPACADTGPAVPTPFGSGAFSSVEDAELAGEFGQGIAVHTASNGDGSESRLAVILWDETKPPVTPTNRFRGVEQAGGRVVISIGAGPGANP